MSGAPVYLQLVGSTILSFFLLPLFLRLVAAVLISLSIRLALLAGLARITRLAFTLGARILVGALLAFFVSGGAHIIHPLIDAEEYLRLFHYAHLMCRADEMSIARGGCLADRKMNGAVPESNQLRYLLRQRVPWKFARTRQSA